MITFLTVWLIVLGATVAASEPLVCQGTAFSGARTLLSRVPFEERYPAVDAAAPTERWISFANVVDAILGTDPLFGDTHARSAFINAVTAGPTATVPCDEHMIARDRYVQKLAMVGYSASDIARMLTGRITRSQVDDAYVRRMAGLAPSSETIFPVRDLPAGTGSVMHTASLESPQSTPLFGVSPVPTRVVGTRDTMPVGLDAAVRHYADAYQVDYRLVNAMIRRESNWQPAAVSAKGAVGLMQLMPNTASMLKVDPTNPVENIKGGVAYLAGLLRTYGTVRTALIAYNAGPVHAGQVVRGERALFSETRRYLDAIATDYPID